MKYLIAVSVCLGLFAQAPARVFAFVGNELPETTQAAVWNSSRLSTHARATATTKYSMKVAVSMPAGTAGAAVTSTQPSNTKLSPCVAGKVDAVTFTLTYTQNTPADKDIYLFLFNPNADGVKNPRFYAFKKNTLTNPVTVTARNDVGDIVAASDEYLPLADNPGGTITETFLGGSILLNGAPTGAWILVGIIADSATVDFNDPTTWTAWDAGTVMIGLPWVGTGAYATCP